MTEPSDPLDRGQDLSPEVSEILHTYGDELEHLWALGLERENIAPHSSGWHLSRLPGGARAHDAIFNLSFQALELAKALAPLWDGRAIVGLIAILRPSLETTIKLGWLIRPGLDPRERLSRALTLLAREQRWLAYTNLAEDVPDSRVELDRLTDLAAESGLPVQLDNNGEACGFGAYRGPPSIEETIEDGRWTVTPDEVKRQWRILNAPTHGHVWIQAYLRTDQMGRHVWINIRSCLAATQFQLGVLLDVARAYLLLYGREYDSGQVTLLEALIQRLGEIAVAGG